MISSDISSNAMHVTQQNNEPTQNDFLMLPCLVQLQRASTGLTKVSVADPFGVLEVQLLCDHRRQAVLPGKKTQWSIIYLLMFLFL